MTLAVLIEGARSKPPNLLYIHPSMRPSKTCSVDHCVIKQQVLTHFKNALQFGIFSADVLLTDGGVIERLNKTNSD